MKRALATLDSTLTTLRRWAAHYRMRSLETTLSGAVDSFPHVRDPLTRERMKLSIRELRRELCKARADYIALLPAGKRIVWDLA